MPLAYIALCAFNKLQYKVYANYTLCTLAYIALCAFNKLLYIPCGKLFDHLINYSTRYLQMTCYECTF